MEIVLLVGAILVAIAVMAAGTSSAWGRNAQEMDPRGDRIPQPPGFDRRDGPL